MLYYKNKLLIMLNNNTSNNEPPPPLKQQFNTIAFSNKHINEILSAYNLKDNQHELSINQSTYNNKTSRCESESSNFLEESPINNKSRNNTSSSFSKCQIMFSGINPYNGVYYLCECDPERSNPICVECFKACHTGEGHGEIKKIEKECVCMCGYKSHQPMNKEDSTDFKYNKTCLFGEWAIQSNYKYFYKDKTNPSLQLCLLCMNLCYKNNSNLYRTSIDNENLPNNTFTCNCEHRNHLDIRILFRKLRSIVKKDNYFTKYDFDNFTLVKLVNMITKAPISFDNIFHSFKDKLNETYEKILFMNMEPNFSYLDDFKFVNNFHLTCAILADYALHIHPPLVYLRDDIKKLLTIEKYFTIMLSDFDFKNRTIWLLKESLTHIFYTFYFSKDFAAYPNMKLRDLSLLTPIQRMTIISNIHKETKLNEYINNINFNILSKTIKLIHKIIQTNETQEHVLKIYNKLYKICQTFAKFSFFNHKQVVSFCSTNNLILHSFYSQIKADKRSLSNQKIKYKVLSPMMKTLMYLIVNYNDQMVYSYLRKERSMKSSINYFHMKSDLSKIICQNVISCLTLIQELTPIYKIEYFQYSNYTRHVGNKNTLHTNTNNTNNRSNGGYEMKAKQKKYHQTYHNINDKGSHYSSNLYFVDYYEDKSVRKVLRSIVNSCQEILRLIFSINESYSSGLERICQLNYANCILTMFNYSKDLLSSEENDIVLFLRNSCDKMENVFHNIYEGNHNENLSHEIMELNIIMEDIINKYKLPHLEYNNEKCNTFVENENDNEHHNHKGLYSSNNVIEEEGNVIEDENDIASSNYKLNNVKKTSTFISKHSKLSKQSKMSLTNSSIASKRSKKKTTTTTIISSVKYLELRPLFKRGAFASNTSNNNNHNSNSNIHITAHNHYNNINNHSNNTSSTNIASSIQQNMIWESVNLLLDKSFIMISLSKVIRIFYDIYISNKANHNETKLFSINESLFVKILTLFKFYISSTHTKTSPLNPSHALFIFTSDIISNIILLNNEQLFNMLNIIDDALHILQDTSTEMPSYRNIIHLIKTVTSKAENNIELIVKILKIIIRVTKIPNSTTIIRKLRKIVMNFYTKCDEHGLSCSLLKPIKHKSSLSSATSAKYKRALKDKIPKYFLRIINVLFTGRCEFEERKFLENILDQNDFKDILEISSSSNMDINLRTELLIFYRIVYIDISLKQSNISYYVSLLINDPPVLKKQEKITNEKYFRFFQHIVKTGSDFFSSKAHSESLTSDWEIIKNELINFKSFIEKAFYKQHATSMNNYNSVNIHKKDNSCYKRVRYLEQGIVLPLCVILGKFSALAFDCNGVDYIHIYELLYYFIEVKIFVFKNKDLFNDEENKEINKTIKQDNILKYKLNIIEGGFQEIIDPEVFTERPNDPELLHELREDLEKLQRNDFEMMNFTLITSYLKKHLNNILINKNICGLKEVFTKSTNDVYINEDEMNMKIQEYSTRWYTINNTIKNKLFPHTNNNSIGAQCSFIKLAYDVVSAYYEGKHNLDKSTFIKMINADNIYFNCKWRILLIRNILFFMNNYYYEKTYRDECLWQLFRLLQYDTCPTQRACLELMDKHQKYVDFDYLLEIFTLNLMNTLIRDINPCFTMIRHDYFITLLIVKILKFFCEEHNQDFQRIFFIKEEDGIALHYNPYQYESLIREEEVHNINEYNEYYESSKMLTLKAKHKLSENVLNKINNKIESMINISSGHDINDSLSNSNLHNIHGNSFGNFNSLNICGTESTIVGESKLFIGKSKTRKPIPDIECENMHEVSRSEENYKEIKNNKASVFEYMISILSKIILLSKWIGNKDKEELDDYFYDLYFVILEFLIETIQGTKSEYLETVFANNKNIIDKIEFKNAKTSNNVAKVEKTNLFGTFLSDINRLVLEDNDCDLSYQVRKEMMNFLMAFLEESATPKNGPIEISTIILPITILDSIVLTMTRLYRKKIIELFRKDPKHSAAVSTLYAYRTIEFNPEMKRFFMESYFSDITLGEDIRFALANRMFQFFKLYSIADSFCNPAVAEFYIKMSQIPEDKVIRYYSLDSKTSRNYNDMNINYDINLSRSLITDKKFLQQYLCVSFFESITRNVFVNYPSSNKPVHVLFTLNPVVPLLSKVSKIDFIENVDRTDRHTKLLALIESCDYFLEEVNFKQVSGKNNILLHYITDLDFFWLEVFSFILTLITNVLMLATLKGTKDSLIHNFLYKEHRAINSIGLTNLLFNCLSLVLWVYLKFHIYYHTACQKMLKKRKMALHSEDQTINDDVSLTIKDKILVGFMVLFSRNKISGFYWNIICCAGAYFTNVLFLYNIQLFSIVYLSQTLKNLVIALTVKGKQLLAVFYLTMVLNLIFADLAFFNFSVDYIKEIDSKPSRNFPNEFMFLMDIIGSPNNPNNHIENECGTLLYCFATHLDYGLRFDGGIADRMKKSSYNSERSYYIYRFFYEELYFIALVMLMLNMIFGIIFEAFSELRNKEQAIEKDKKEICFICGMDKESCKKKGEKLDEHLEHVHNIWTYVEYIMGLRFVDLQETNAINSYVIESIEKKELLWFPYDETKKYDEENRQED